MTYEGATLDSGNLNLEFAAPGGGNTGIIRFLLESPGAVSASLSSLPWLQYDWDGDGAFDGDPGEREDTFGCYRGHDKVIFWQKIKPLMANSYRVGSHIAG